MLDIVTLDRATRINIDTKAEQFTPVSAVDGIVALLNQTTDNAALKGTTTDKADFVAAFVKRLPDLLHVPDEPPIFWERLGVWFEQVVGKLMADEERMAHQLAKLDHTLLSALVAWLDLPLDRPTITTMAGVIAAGVIATDSIDVGSTLDSKSQAASDLNIKWAKPLFLLDTLLHGRSHQALEEMARVLLDPSTVELLMQSPLTLRSRRLAIGLLIYLQNPADLQLVILYERSERFNYNRHVMLRSNRPDDSRGIEEECRPFQPRHRNRAVEEAARQPTPNATKAPTEADINLALARFEAGPRGGRHSSCLRVLTQPNGHMVIFIYRNLQQRSINEMNRTLFGEEVEVIVLKFYDNMQTLEERSTKGIGHLIAQAIAETLMHQPISYIADEKLSPLPALRQLLNSVRHGKDSALALVEVHLSQAAVPGNPTMVLRGSRYQPLASTLDFFDAQGVPLLDELAALRHVGLAFESIIDGQRSSNIFKVRIDVSSRDSAIVRYIGPHSSSRMCANFEKWIRETYNVTAIPSAR